MRTLPEALFVVALGALACSGDEDAAGPGASGGDAGTGGTQVADGGWAATGAGGTGSSGGSSPLPCDAAFAFSPDPPRSGDSLTVSFTDPSPLVYVDLVVSAGGSPTVVAGAITTQDPWTWTWTVSGLVPGVATFTFRDGEPQTDRASCAKMVADTGLWDGGTGSGGHAGTGGSGHCCKLVGTDLANASPCGPSASSSPWKILDNAGCNAGGCEKIWCPFEKCDSAKYPGGCPQGTEACWINDSFSTYEDACKSCCESYGACWDSAIGTCRHPGDCGTAIWQCPWQ